MKRPLLSVVVPITDPDKYILNLENWFIQEDFENVEVVFVQDGVDFQKNQLLTELASRFPQIAISIHAGDFDSAGYTRNFGISQANGEWITFCDADDFQFTSTIKAMLDDRFNIIFGQFQRRSLDGRLPSVSKTHSVSDLWVDPGFWRGAYKKSILSQVYFTNLKIGEDIVFLSDLLRQNSSLSFSKSIFYEYRIGVQGQATSIQKNYGDIVKAIELIKAKNPSWMKNENDLGFLTRLAFSQLKFMLKHKKILNMKEMVSVLLTCTTTRLDIPLFNFVRREKK